jgi:hypothetical protein
MRTAQPGGHRWSQCRPDCDLAPLSPRHLFLRTDGRGPVRPGLLATAAASFVFSEMIHKINAATVAVVLGGLVTNLGLHRTALRAGTHVATHRLLRLAIVLLGLQLGLPQLRALGLSGLAVAVVTVAVTFGGTHLLGRLLRLSRTRTLLIATGFSICGASAVAAMSDVADADEDDIAVAIALVTCVAASPSCCCHGSSTHYTWTPAALAAGWERVSTTSVRLSPPQAVSMVPSTPQWLSSSAASSCSRHWSPPSACTGESRSTATQTPVSDAPGHTAPRRRVPCCCRRHQHRLAAGHRAAPGAAAAGGPPRGGQRQVCDGWASTT